MMGRETGVTTAGVGLRRSAGEATGALVRLLGDFEPFRVLEFEAVAAYAAFTVSGPFGGVTLPA